MRHASHPLSRGLVPLVSEEVPEIVFGRIAKGGNVGSDAAEVVVEVLDEFLEDSLHGGDVIETNEDLLKELRVGGVSSGH